jgi:predicted ATPase
MVRSPVGDRQGGQDGFLQAARGTIIEIFERGPLAQLGLTELRAMLRVSGLWQQQGRTAEARQRLQEIYDWFSEGFDTKDLQNAKALLDVLA